MARGWKL